MTAASKFERATPESQGVDSAAINALVEAANQYAFHSLMVVRHGKVIAEGWWSPYTADEPHMMFSVSKSVTATAIGMLVAEGRASLDEEITAVFPNIASDEDKRNMQGVKVRHLLAMATGHAVDTMEIMRALPREDWVKIFFGIPIEYPPNTHFLYNSGASYVLAAMITARTGMSVKEYLEPRLFQPLGITNAPWEKNPRGINFGASGLRLTTEDLAKFGQLYLNEGVWGGKRILTEAWVAEATAKQVSNGTDPTHDWSQGYGFQIWRSRHNSYRMDGRYGQFALVLPEQDMVIAITAGVTNNRVVPDFIYEHLLPGVKVGPLPENATAQARLKDALASQMVALPAFLPTDPSLATQVNGRKITLSYNLIGASAVTLSFSANSIDMNVERRDGGAELLPAGRTAWLPGLTHMWPHEEMQQARLESRAGWTDARTLEIRQQCIETPFSRNWKLEFDGPDKVTVSVGLDNGFWVERTEVLAGELS
ncbi:MAG TPA: serine hydrolase [Devosiaceae bacterium]|nr:serine hydrolase [Devosiaceae bacterium]